MSLPKTSECLLWKFTKRNKTIIQIIHKHKDDNLFEEIFVNIVTRTIPGRLTQNLERYNHDFRLSSVQNKTGLIS